MLKLCRILTTHGLTKPSVDCSSRWYSNFWMISTKNETTNGSQQGVPLRSLSNRSRLKMSPNAFSWVSVIDRRTSSPLSFRRNTKIFLSAQQRRWVIDADRWLWGLKMDTFCRTSVPTTRGSQRVRSSRTCCFDVGDDDDGGHQPTSRPNDRSGTWSCPKIVSKQWSYRSDGGPTEMRMVVLLGVLRVENGRKLISSHERVSRVCEWGECY